MYNGTEGNPEAAERLAPPSRGTVTAPLPADPSEQPGLSFDDLPADEYFKLFCALPAPAAVASMADGVIIGVNDAWVRESGFTRAETIGHTLVDLGLFSQAGEMDSLLQTLAAQGRTITHEFEFRRKSGQTSPYLTSLSSILLGGRACVLGVAQDISAQKALKETLEETAVKFRTLFDASRDAIGVAKAGIHEYVNPAYLELFGVTNPDDLVGRPLVDFIAPESQEQIRDYAMRRSRGEPVPTFYETRGQRLDGSVFDMNVRVSTYVLNGQRYTLALIRDITDLKQTQMALSERLKEMTCLAEVGRILSQSLAPEEVYRQVTASVVQAMQFPEAAVAVLEVHHQRYASSPYDEPDTPGLHADIVVRDRPCGRLSVYYRDAREFLLPYESDLLNGVTDDLSLWLERNQAELALRESQATLSAIIESTTDLIWSVDIETFGLLTFNLALRDYFREQRGRELRVGMRPEEIFATQDYVDQWRGMYRRALEAGPFSTEYVVANGSTILQVAVQILKRDGAAFGVSVFAKDITEQKRAEDMIRQRNRMLLALHQVAIEISAELRLSVLINTILEQAEALLDVDRGGAVYLYEPEANVLRLAHGSGINRGRNGLGLPLGQGVAGRVYGTAQPLIVDDYTRWEGHGAILVADPPSTVMGVPLILKGQVAGVLTLVANSQLRTFGPLDVQLAETFAAQAAISIDNAQLFENLQRSNADLLQAYDATIQGWSAALDLRDKETEGHSQRVTEMTLRLARALQMREEELVQVRRGALLHDIGKLGIPDAILLKPGPLDDSEWQLMRRHPQLAYDMLAPIAYLNPALDIPFCHHEKWDGSGYPRGLRGEQIPLAARIFALVDVWDALTSDRPYRPAWTKEQVVAYIREQAGKHFDPDLTAAFLAMIGDYPE
jgi:PAS domain S-box-containing protein